LTGLTRHVDDAPLSADREGILMTDNRTVVIVGAGLGGLKTAEELRRVGFTGSITLIGDDPLPPYDRPPLSKDVLKGTKANPPTLADDQALQALDLALLTDAPVVALDPANHQVRLADDRVVRYDALVIATGARARHWGVGEGAANIWPLRTAADAANIAEVIGRQGRLAVLGAGFIGCEVAASAREMGCEVTMIEMLATPLAHLIGAAAGQEIARRQVAAGVDLRCETTIEDVQLVGDQAKVVNLSDGTSVEVDGVVVGVGVVPNTEWLEGSGVLVDNGVVCDSSGASSIADVYAVGDVARWVNVHSGRHVRVEHWTNAIDHAGIVARRIASAASTESDDPGHEVKQLAEIPYFWSDQYGTKIQALGEPSASADVTLVLAGAAGDRPLYLYSRSRQLTGVLGFGLARAVMRMRPLLTERATLAEALAAVQEIHPDAELVTG
jgi:3-phenylpropionate/trans-cinnamate dioxygenase ferredoxin reductase subunit